jgi:hypothetical protein
MSKEKELTEYEKQLQDYEDELKKASENLNQREQQINQFASQAYGNQNKQNLVEWELDFKPELDDIARSLRCDVLKIDDQGNQYWIRNPSPERIFLNELGVNDVLRKIILLVNKNKVLSNYTIEEIRARVQQIGHEIRALIYNNYEAYGIDNDYKMNNYPSIVMDILDIIEGSYRRALSGETHKGLNEQRLVTQSDSLNARQQTQPQQNKVSWINPTTWGN